MSRERYEELKARKRIAELRAKRDQSSGSDISGWESAGRGAAQGATMGFADELVGAARGMYDDAKALFTGGDANNGVKVERDQFGNVTNGDKLTGNYAQYRDEYRAADKKAQEANPEAYLAGDVVGSVASSFVPGLSALNAGKGAKLGEMMVKGGIQGGIGGFGRAEGDFGEQLADTATGAALGSAGGAAARGLTVGASKMGEFAKNKVAPIVQRQADESTIKALGGSQKQVQDLGGKLSDAAKLARDEGIVTPFASSNKIADRASSFVQDSAAKTRPLYEAAENTSASTGELIRAFDDEIAKLEGNPGMSPLREALQRKKQALIQEAQAGYNPSQLRAYRGAEDKLTNFQSELPAQEAKQITRNMLREKEMGLLEGVDPALRAQNEDLFRKIHLGNLIEDMADKGAARSTNNNLFGINSQILGSGAGAAIGGASTGDWEGVAAGAGGVMAAREVLKRYGPQLAGVGLNKLANAMSSPSFSAVFEQAARRGPAAVMALHTSLKRNNPEYASLVGD